MATLSSSNSPDNAVTSQANASVNAWQECCMPIGKAFVSTQTPTETPEMLETLFNSASLIKFGKTVQDIIDKHQEWYFQLKDPEDQRSIYDDVEQSSAKVTETAGWLHDYLQKKPYTVLGTLKHGGLVYRDPSQICLWEKDDIPESLKECSVSNQVQVVTAGPPSWQCCT